MAPFEQKTRQRKPEWAFTLRSVSFAASGIRDGRCMYSELLPQAHIVTGSIYVKQLQKAVREKRPRPASVCLLHEKRSSEKSPKLKT